VLKERYVALVASIENGERVVSPLGCRLRLPTGFSAVEYNDAPVDVATRARGERAWWEGQWYAKLSTDDRELLHDALRNRLEGDNAQPRRDSDERARVKRGRALVRELDALEHDTKRAATLGTQVGYQRFEADVPRDGSIEIVRYRLPHALAPIDFYKAAKPSAKSQWRGTRVPRLFSINGVDAVRLYVEIATTRGPHDEWPKFVYHYLVNGLDGWTIECGCERDEFAEWRASMLDIVASFECAPERDRLAS
jgi:hypothetical protein